MKKTVPIRTHKLLASCGHAFILGMLIQTHAFNAAAAENCTSRYEPYFTGTCMNRGKCLGALINNLCTGSANACCIDETSASGETLVSAQNLVSLAGVDTARIRYLSTVITAPKTSPSCGQTAAYLAQLAHESARFQYSEEVGAESYFDRYENRNDLGNTQPGDGRKYRGRGFIQITGRANYKQAGDALGLDLVNSPELAAFPVNAAKIAVWYWTSKDLNTFADGTFYGFSRITSLINGGLNNFRDRVDLLDKANALFNCGDLLKGHGEKCTISKQDDALCKPLCGADFAGRKYCGCNGLTAANKCAGPSNVVCCSETKSDIDLAFVLDSSGSIASADFQQSLAFASSIIQSVNVGEYATRVALINFSRNVQVVTKLNSVYDKAALLSTVAGISQIGSSTATGEALQVCESTIFTVANGMRAIGLGVPKIILVLTDGQSNGYVAPGLVAARLRAAGVSIISIGVGSYLNFAELAAIASPSRVYLLSNFQAVVNSFDDILQLAQLEPAMITTLTSRINVEKDSFKVNFVVYYLKCH